MRKLDKLKQALRVYGRSARASAYVDKYVEEYMEKKKVDDLEEQRGLYFPNT